MNKLRLFILVLLLPVFLYSVTDNNSNLERMLLDLDIIKNTFDVMYAPATWKKEFCGWDLSEKIAEAKSEILQNKHMALKDYQRIILKFFKSTRDYHVNIHFYSTESSTLPFRIKGINGRYFVVWARKSSPLQQGDEIISFDGRPLDEIIREIKDQDVGHNYSATDQALAELWLTNRMGNNGVVVPKGFINVAARKNGNPEIINYTLQWNYVPEQIDSPLFARTPPADKTAKRYLYSDMTVPFYRSYLKNKKIRKLLMANSNEDSGDEDDDDGHFIGNKKGFLLALGEVVEVFEFHNLYAYVYLNDDGKKIGYLRIPHYMHDDYKHLAEIINHFEEKTEALVLDQQDNPGGALLFAYTLLSMLTNEPLLFVPQQRRTLTQQDIYEILHDKKYFEKVANDEEAEALFDGNDNISGYPVNYELIKQILSYFEFTLNEWREGRHLTIPCHWNGIDIIKPHPRGCYSKPILCLINNLDFSCADFVPAILQDNKRAVIFGTRTAGAGGYVLAHMFPNLFGIDYYTFTGSIAERIDNTPIENMGVKPDIEAVITENDLKNNYADYVKKINKAVTAILAD